MFIVPFTRGQDHDKTMWKVIKPPPVLEAHSDGYRDPIDAPPSQSTQLKESINMEGSSRDADFSACLRCLCAL